MHLRKVIMLDSLNRAKLPFFVKSKNWSKVFGQFLDCSKNQHPFPCFFLLLPFRVVASQKKKRIQVFFVTISPGRLRSPEARRSPWFLAASPRAASVAPWRAGDGDVNAWGWIYMTWGSLQKNKGEIGLKCLMKSWRKKLSKISHCTLKQVQFQVESRNHVYLSWCNDMRKKMGTVPKHGRQNLMDTT